MTAPSINAARDTCAPANSSCNLAASGLGKNPDWVGLWFKLLEEMSGEFVGMRGGRRAENAGEISWVFPSHATSDGLGGFVQLLRQDAPGANLQLPRLRESKKPSLLARAVALFRLLARTPRAAAAWTSVESAWKPPSGTAHAGTAVATECFDVDYTIRLSEKARAESASLNSLLLSALGRASQSKLENGPAYWMMPINMRGPVTLPNENANHTAYLRIELGRNETPSQVHEQVKQALYKREHWGSWLFLNAGRLMGYTGMRWIYKRELARYGGRPCVGAFSNLGSWDGCSTWFVCPPVSTSCPLGVGVVICNGQLSLTIEAHPSIGRDAVWARALMDRWLAELATLLR